MATRIALPISASARQATSILQAWEDHDPCRFDAALNCTLNATSGDRLTAGEAERAELLKGIAWEFTASWDPMRPAAGADSERIDVCVELLRHLIATDPCLVLQAR